MKSLCVLRTADTGETGVGHGAGMARRVLRINAAIA